MHPSANYPDVDATSPGGPHSRSSTRRRNPMACLICRKRKIKCEFNNGTDVCDHCRSKNTKCPVLSVAQEEALKAWGYTDEYLASTSSTELEALQRRLAQQLHNSTDHIETYPSAPLPHNNHGTPSSPHHPLPSTGQDRSRAYDPGNRAAPSPYNNSAHNNHTASRTGPTSLAPVSINTPHPQVHAHHQYHNYPVYTSPSPDHQVPYQIPATGDASVPHHTMVNIHHVQQLNPDIPTHSNAVQSQDHMNYSGQTSCPFQAAQQQSQGQMTQYQYGGYPPTTTSGYTHDDSWTQRR